MTDDRRRPGRVDRAFTAVVATVSVLIVIAMVCTVLVLSYVAMDK